MRIALSITLVAALVALTPATSSAQDERKVHVNIGGGPTFIGGNAGEHFSTGWGPAIGVTYDHGMFGVQFEYAYRWFDLNSDTAPLFDATTLDANQTMQQLDFNFVGNFARPGSAIRPYGIVGPGLYYRQVEITQYVGSGVICDPWYYVCGAYPVSDVIGSRGGWDWGFNVGGGVGFSIGESSEFYIETRYHYVWGPEIATPAQLPAGADPKNTNTNGSYWPLTFGFRF
jgi:hypothetical protein